MRLRTKPRPHTNRATRLQSRRSTAYEKYTIARSSTTSASGAAWSKSRPNTRTATQVSISGETSCASSNTSSPMRSRQMPAGRRYPLLFPHRRRRCGPTGKLPMFVTIGRSSKLRGSPVSKDFVLRLIAAVPYKTKIHTVLTDNAIQSPPPRRRFTVPLIERSWTSSRPKTAAGFKNSTGSRPMSSWAGAGPDSPNAASSIYSSKCRDQLY